MDPDEEFESFLKQAERMGIKEPDKVQAYIQQCYERKDRNARLQLEKEREQAIRQEKEKLLLAENKKLELEIQLQSERFKHEKDMREKFPDYKCELEKQSAKIPLPKLKSFNESKDEIDSFLFRFENHAKLSKWPGDMWVSSLSSLLEGQALSLYHSLSAAGTLTYERLKQSLLIKFRCTRDGFREKFRTAVPEQEESFPSFQIRMAHYIDRWIELAKIERTFEGLLNLVVAEQFLASVSQDLVTYLKEKDTLDVDKLVTLAEAYREAHPNKNLARRGAVTLCAAHAYEKRQSKPQPNFQPSNQFSKEIQNQSNESRRTWFSGNDQNRNRQFGRGRFSYQSRNPTHGGQNFSWDSRQKFGNQYGSEDSGYQPLQGPGSLRNRQQSQRGVYNATAHCAEELEIPTKVTHDVDEKQCVLASATVGLPVTEGIVNGQKVGVLRDTGANIAGVRASLVQPGQMMSETRSVRCFGGDVHKYRVAEVNVDTPFFTGPLVCCVLDNPVADLVLGNVKGVSLPVGLLVGNAAITRAQAKKETQTIRPLEVASPDVHIDRSQLIQRQRQDPSLSHLFELTGKDCSSRSPKGEVRFLLNGGLLLRRYTRKDGRTAEQIVLPTSLRQSILSVAHDTPLAGHGGVRRTLFRVYSNFYWPGVHRDVSEFVRSCHECQVTSPKGRVPTAPLELMPIITEPFCRVAIDIMGPFSPPADGKYRFILSMVDVATRYPDAVPLKDITSQTVAEQLMLFFSRMGFPKEILSDNGGQFTSDMIKEFLRLLAIDKVTVSPYHAQANGVVERFHGTIKPMLRRIVQKQPREWHRYLPALLFACREVPSETTGFSPFELLFGRQARGPLDLIASAWTEDQDPSENRSSYQHVYELKNVLKETAELVKENMRTAAQKNKRYKDRDAIQRVFNVGDEVLLLLPTSSNKLLMAWKGPYKVVKRVNNDYIISIKGREKVFHVNMLKKYIRRDLHTSTALVVDDYTETVSTQAVSPSQPQEASPAQSSTQSFVEILPADFLPLSEDACASTAVLPPQLEDEPLSIETLPPGKETFKDVVFDPELSQARKQELSRVFLQFPHILTANPGSFTGHVEHEIRVTTEKPVFKKQYPLPFKSHDIIDKEVDTMLEMGVIEQSSSPYSAPVVLVGKKDGSTRFCIDFRELNKVTVADAEPIPDVEELFSFLGDKQFFTKVDLAKGYWQVIVKAQDRPKTAFQTRKGLFQFVKMPFGLVSAPATFARVMRCLQLQECSSINFFDDILVASNSWQLHLKHVHQVLQKLSDFGLTARPTKVLAGFQEIEFLGHIVGKGHVKPDDSKIKKILQVSTPGTKKQVQSLLGLVGYYRKFIPHFSSITAPITDVLKGKSRSISWTPACTTALSQIQEILADYPVLRLPDMQKEFLLRTDASSSGLGAALMQNHDDVWHPVAFISRKLLDREKQYSIIEKECLAIVWSVDKLRKYLWGTHFTLQTDHNPLTFLRSNAFRNSRLMRWALSLQEFKFDVERVPGSENILADILSRSATDQTIHAV